jgi:hypothetical protein
MTVDFVQNRTHLGIEVGKELKNYIQRFNKMKDKEIRKPLVTFRTFCKIFPTL